MVSQRGCGESLTCAARMGIAILVSRLGRCGWPSSSVFFCGKKPTFPILSPHFFCVTKKKKSLVKLLMLMTF